MSPGYTNPAGSPVPTPLSGKGSKAFAKSKAAKGQKSCPQTPLCASEYCTFSQELAWAHESSLSREKLLMLTPSSLPGSPGNPVTPVGGCRYDSSLGKKSNSYFNWCSRLGFEVWSVGSLLIYAIYRYCLSGLLTKKFLNLLKGAPGGIVDLNNAAETLEVNISFCFFLISCLLTRLYFVKLICM